MTSVACKCVCAAACTRRSALAVPRETHQKSRAGLSPPRGEQKEVEKAMREAERLRQAAVVSDLVRPARPSSRNQTHNPTTTSSTSGFVVFVSAAANAVPLLPAMIARAETE
eukprot:1845642-Rhodomonas_salina.1